MSFVDMKLVEIAEIYIPYMHSNESIAVQASATSFMRIEAEVISNR